MQMRGLLLCAPLLFCHAAVPEDLVQQPLPGFPVGPFKVYSGYLNISGPVAGYDRLMIHYQLDMSQGSPEADPLIAWHTGGPGGSSIYAAYAETGYFQTSTDGLYVNEHAWNRVANMLYLESPAGSFLSPSNEQSGFSWCEKKGVIQPECHWNDTSQAEAYGHTLLAFFAAFPELKQNKFYLVGESYAGQYIPNIAHFLLTSPLTTSIRLDGIAVGNGCWGGTADSVQCNGPNSARNDVEFYYGHGTISKQMYETIQNTCHFADYTPSLACEAQLALMSRAVGPHNVYDLYDNCPTASSANMSSRQILEFLRGFPTPAEMQATLGGGYQWSCGSFDAVPGYILRDDVKKALHLGAVYPSSFAYTQSGPASVTLYPFIASKVRVLIYNGDADTCVPYVGNEEWTTGLAAKGILKETKAWHPWMANGTGIPTGYATSYNVSATPTNDFTFLTIRLAGHEVPNFRPAASFYMIDQFLGNRPF
ncbi:putative serine carboxypeptidase F13S12.6 [Diplonema papillatum]|nr:putative serine carboxypeptidase F13S12.6 [Diplonema papillatum]